MTVVCDAVVEDGWIVSTSGDPIDVPWWSFTKTVIAATALTLVRDGALALDDQIAGRRFTLRQLLQHRAGVTNYGRLADYHEAVARRADAWPAEELLARCDSDRLIYPPGEGWAYSNIGYLFVRRLIEETTGQDLGAAIQRLVLRPLGMDAVRLAERRSDLASVAMGTAHDYHPGWVYHGLLVGPVSRAASLLNRLMAGALLPPELLDEMLRGHPVGGPIPGRPWVSPGYGLGVMTGGVASGAIVAGHTGGGPGSAIAVYQSVMPPARRTVAAFAASEGEAAVEERCLR